MKKNILKIGIASFLSATVLAISVSAATGNLNIFVSEDGFAEREDLVEVSAVQFFSDEKIQLNYDVSRSVKDGFADIYKDENGNDYIYKNGKLTGFYSNEIKMPANEATPIGKESSIKIAKDWLTQFSDHIEDYEMQSFEEKENYGQYYITFARKLGEIFTDEQAIVSVMYDGAVKSVAVYNDGKYDNVSENIVEGITEEALKSYAESEMEIIYPNEGNAFKITDYCLEQDADGYYISICGNMDNTFQSVRYELEN
jgi:hypothetical protein